MLKRITSYVYYHGTVCRLHMIFEFERVSTNLQCDGDGLALVKVKHPKDTTLCQNRMGSSPTPVVSICFRVGYDHRWHCMECTSYWPEYIHIVNIMYISAVFSQISFGYHSQGIHQQIISNPENAHHLDLDWRNLIQSYNGMEKDWP